MHVIGCSHKVVFYRKLNVYTFFEGSGSGEEAIPDNWYQWEPVE